MHTKKVKAGESERRSIDPPQLCEALKKTDVKICAITNHNCFDKKQYDAIVAQGKNFFQAWPGVELDINENGKRGHLIVIVNPKYAPELSEAMGKATSSKSPDEFALSLEDVVKIFDSLDPIYIAHYQSKRPSMRDEEIKTLIDKAANRKRILKEASNAISAGIFVSHGHKSIYGSDIQDWSEYLNISRTLPDLRLPVESFEQFCLLLERDDSTINTILEKKKPQEITINPFAEDGTPIKLKIYDDINVLFGSKGTGKTEILRALSKYYNSNGYQTNLYESSANSLNEKYDIKGEKFELDIDSLGIDNCVKEISDIRNATDSSVTSLRKYREYFSADETNKVAKSIKIGDPLIDDVSSANRFQEIHSFQKQVGSFLGLLESKSLYEEIIGKELFKNFKRVLADVSEKIKIGLEAEFIESNSIRLFNQFVETFNSEIAKKTGHSEKPIKTGFFDYAVSRIKIEKFAKKITSMINRTIEPNATFVSDLGEKGGLFCKTILVIQNGTVSDGALKPVTSVMKTPQKAVANFFKKILDEVYSDSLFARINELNNFENGDSVASIKDLILFKRIFEANHMPYKPSNGESAMVLLQQELSEKKEIFIIDEPEKSLGNDYINDFIVPLLKEHAYSGKRIIIATHDANIAVRTLPYNTIYREHDVDCYRTYAGNPFSNSLVCQTPGKDNLDWKETSMRILEGGREAFGERGKIYGKP